MAFNNFPYSDMHELNLDWVIKTCKQAATDALQAITKADNIETFVNNYFDNLDVQSEINNKINSMIDTGEFQEILNSVVSDSIPTVVTAWLNTHITQETGYVIDTSLTVSGAAADAKVVGDKALLWRGACPADTTTALSPGFYTAVNASNNATGLPTGYHATSGCILVLKPGLNDRFTFQILIGADIPSDIYTRYIDVISSPHVVYSWSKTATYKEILETIHTAHGNAGKVVSLSGNIFDAEKATWIVGFEGNGTLYTTSGYHYAYAPLNGPGTYVRYENYVDFGDNTGKVPIYKADKTLWKVLNVGVNSNNHSYSNEFTLTEEDMLSAAYTIISIKDSTGYAAALFYNAVNIPMAGHPYRTGKLRPNWGFDTDPLYRKTVLCFGDSIAYGSYDLPSQVLSWYGRLYNDFEITGTNYAVAGATITSGVTSGGQETHAIVNDMATAYSQHNTADYVILEGGTNDADLIGSITTGTTPENFGTFSQTNFSGNYDTTTFCGAVEMLFYRAINYWRYAKICFIIPCEMGHTIAAPANRRAYFDKIKEIALKWHIPVLDLWDNSVLNAKLAAYYDSNMTGADNVTYGKAYYDGQHPTSYGYDAMQNKIVSFLKSL